MSMQEALKLVLADIEAMTPEQLRAELEKHKDGEIAVALRETSEFLVKFEMTKTVEVLKQVRELIASGKESFICHAIDRVGDQREFKQIANRLTLNLNDQLQGRDAGTIITFLRNKHGQQIMERIAPDLADAFEENRRTLRLSLLDYMIACAEDEVPFSLEAWEPPKQFMGEAE